MSSEHLDDAARRQRGLAMMKDVYGWDIPHVEGAFVESTVDHLFADVWAEGTMTIKERRLMLIGMAVAGGMEDVASPVSYTHLRAHETGLDLVCRLLLEKKKKTNVKTHACSHTTVHEHITAYL